MKNKNTAAIGKREDVSILRAIADGKPDSKLHPFLNAAVPRLHRLGWLRAAAESEAV